MGRCDVPAAVGAGDVPVAAPGRRCSPRSTDCSPTHADELDPGELADAYLAILPMRVSSRNTIRPVGRGREPRPRGLGRQGAARPGRGRGARPRRRRAHARDRAGRRSATPRVGATSISTAAPRRSTAGPSRSSGRSSPTASSASREADVVALDQETIDLFAARCAASSTRPTPTAPPRSKRSGGATSSLTDAARSCRSCSGSRVSARARSALLDDVAVEGDVPGFRHGSRTSAQLHTYTRNPDESGGAPRRRRPCRRRARPARIARRPDGHRRARGRRSRVSLVLDERRRAHSDPRHGSHARAHRRQRHRARRGRSRSGAPRLPTRPSLRAAGGSPTSSSASDRRCSTSLPSTRERACSSVNRSARSRRSSIASPMCWWPCAAAGVAADESWTGDTVFADRGREVSGGTRVPARGRELSPGDGRDRLHPGARPSPLHPARNCARCALRVGARAARRGRGGARGTRARPASRRAASRRRFLAGCPRPPKVAFTSTSVDIGQSAEARSAPPTTLTLRPWSARRGACDGARCSIGQRGAGSALISVVSRIPRSSCRDAPAHGLVERHRETGRRARVPVRPGGRRRSGRATRRRRRLPSWSAPSPTGFSAPQPNRTWLMTT